MPDADTEVPFVIDYELSVDDLREGETIRRRAAWRAAPLANRCVLPVFSLVLFAASGYADYRLDVCVQDPSQVLTGQCTQSSLTSPLSQVLMLAWAGGGILVLTIFELTRAWARPSRGYIRKRMKTLGLQGRCRYEVAADGLTRAGSDGTTAYVPWPVITAVRETDQRFLLFPRHLEHGWVLPKRGLSDQSSVQQLGEFLRASVGREPPPT
jgi:hypothetical protein